MSEEDFIQREAIATQQLLDLWELYSCTFVYQEKKRYLFDFLKRFVEFFESYDPLIIKLRFAHIDDVARTLSLYLSEELACILKYGPQIPNVPSAVPVYEYLAGMSGIGEGLYLLRAIEILTRVKENSIPASLGKALVTILVKILSLPPNFFNSSSMTTHRAPIGYHHHHFRSVVPVPNYNFSPICTYFKAPSVHPSFSSLFGESVISPPVTYTSTPGSRVGRIRPRGRVSFDTSANTTCGIICYHILSILGNMFSDEANLGELLLKHDCTTPLLTGIMAIQAQANDFFIVHRQFLRALSKLLATACDSLYLMNLVVARQVFPSLINILKNGPGNGLSTVLSLELSQLLVFALKKSSRVNPCLLDEFNSNNGYTVLADNLIYVSKVGTAEQKLDFISTACHLLFIGSAFEEDARVPGIPPHGVLNVEVFQKIFLRVFAAGTTEDMKTELLKTIRAIFNIGTSSQFSFEFDGFTVLSHLSPFKTLFFQFDSLSITNRRMVLAMMDEVLPALGCLRNDEMQAYCYLLQGKRPSTLLLITQHMTALLAEHRLSSDKMKEVGLVPVLIDYLVHPHELACRSMLVDPAELALSASLLPHTYFTPETFAAEQAKHPNMNFDIKTLNVLYGISVCMLNLMLLFLADNALNQSTFHDMNGLKKLYQLLSDNILIQPALRVLAIMAIGSNLRLEMKIVPSLILTLQASGGATTLDSNVLVMRKYVLSTLCYIFHHNQAAKNAFRAGGGFAWAVTILDGIGRVMKKIRQHERELYKNRVKPPPLQVGDRNDGTTLPTSVSYESLLASPVADREGSLGVANLDTAASSETTTPVATPDATTTPTSMATIFANVQSSESISADNAEGSELATPISPTSPKKVLESSTSSIHTSSASLSPPTSPSDARGKGVRFADDPNAIALDAPTNASDANAQNGNGAANPSAATPPPNYPTRKEIFYFLKALLDTLTAVLNSHTKNQSYFRGDIRFSTLTETLKACHFIEGEHAVELCDSLLNMAVIGSWPPCCPHHRMASPSLLSNFPPYLYHPTMPESNQLVMPADPEEEGVSYEDGNFIESITPQLTFAPEPVEGLRISTDFIDAPISPSEDFHTKPPDPALVKATELISHCTACRESMQIENPEIFKIIFQLMGGTDADARRNIAKLDYRSTSTILKSMQFLTCLSSVNMQRLSSAGLLVDILGYFKPMFTDRKAVRLKHQKKGKGKNIRGLLLNIVQALGCHNITVAELRKYFELLRNPNAPIQLTDALICMARRENTPCYNIDFSKNGLEYVDVPIYLERPWPPQKGYFINFWMRVSSYGVDPSTGHPLPICLFSMEGNKGMRLEAHLHNNVLTFSVYPHTGNPDSHMFTDVHFEEGTWYHVAIAHYIVSVPLTAKKSVVKMYVNGSARTHGILMFPKTTTCRVSVRFGATTTGEPVTPPPAASNQPPLPVFFNSTSPIPSWQLGPVYFFEDLPANDMEVFLLYSLGPNYTAGLKSDMGLTEVFESFTEKNARLHAYQVDYMLHPTQHTLANLHEKITFILCPRNLVVAQVFKIPTFPAAGATAPAVTRMLAPSYANAFPRVQTATNQASYSSPSPLPLSSSASSLMMTPSSSPLISPSPSPLGERTMSMSNLFQVPSTPGTPNGTSRPTTPSIFGPISSNMPQLLSLSMSALEKSPSRDSPPPTNLASSLFSVSPSAPTPTSSSAPPAPYPTLFTPSSFNSGTPTPSPALPMPNMLNFASPTSGNPSQSAAHDLGPPVGVRVRNGVKDILYNIGGVSTIIYLIATAQEVEFQRSSMRLLYNVLQNNARNLREMKEIGGYQMVARLMRKKRWELDETMLAIVFGFAGLHKNIKSPSYYSSGVISDLMAFKYFLLEWKIWKRASLAIQKSLFESLAKLISVHDYAVFNIARFRQVKATQTLINMFQEPDLPSAVMPALLTILKNLLRESSHLTEDLQPLFQYIIATHPTPHITQVAVTYTDRGISSPVPTFRRRKAVSDDRLILNTDGGGVSVRVMVLALLLDVLASLDSAAAVEEFTQLCGIDILFGLLNHDSLRTRIIILKLLDLCIKTPGMSAQFKVNGFAILGSLLQNFEVSEELFGVLVCMMLGNKKKSWEAPGELYGALTRVLGKYAPWMKSLELDPEYPLLFGQQSPPVTKPNNPSDGKPAYRFQAQESATGASYIQGFFLGQLNSDLFLQHPAAVSTILTLLGSSRDISPSLQHSIIKIIHDIFLQNDAVKVQMLENGLIDGLVELLVSNFQIRHARFVENEAPLGWETEEDILYFFKEIAQYGCKNQAGIGFLKEILLTINLYSTLPYTYVCSLQRRVLQDVFVFYHDNDFTAHEQLSASFEKLCTFTVNLLCYQTPGNFTNKPKLSRHASIAGLRESATQMTGRSDLSEDLSSPRGEDEAAETSASTPQSLQDTASDLRTSSTGLYKEGASDVNLRATSALRESDLMREREPISNLSDTTTQDESSDDVTSSGITPRGTANLQLAGNDDEEAQATKTDDKEDEFSESITVSVAPPPPADPAEQPATSTPAVPGLRLPTPLTSSLSPTRSSTLGERSPNSSPRGGNLTVPTPTLMRSNSDFYVVEEQRGALSQSMELYARQQEWIELGHLYNEQAFIDLLFTVFTSRRRAAAAVTSHVEYFAAMSTALLLRTYLSKLIIHFLQSAQYERYLSHILSLLLSNGPEDAPIVTDFILDEESILRILFALKHMLGHSDDAIVAKVKKIIQVVFQVASLKPALAYKKMVLLRGEEDTEFNQVLETMLTPDVPQELVPDFRKWTDKDIASKKDFHTLARETFKQKQEAFSKTQAAIRFNKHLVNTTMAHLTQQQFKPFHERMQLDMEEEREQQQQWRRLVKRVAHERGIWPAQDQCTVIKWELDPTEGPARMRIRLKSVDQHPSAPFVAARQRVDSTEPSEVPEFLSPEVMKAHYQHLQAEHHASISDLKAYTSYTINPRERVITNLRTSRITPFAQQHGELLIGENNLYFIDERRMQGNNSSLGASRSGRIRQTFMGDKPKQVMFPYEEIREIHKRRHLLKNNALEIFLLNGKTYLLAFEKMSDRDSVYDKIMAMDLPDLINYQTEMQGTILKMSVTKKWQKGLISNFEYLMHLNTLAGRSFNDLTQYPVFPFIMRDREEYDVDNPDNMRDLTKPMGAQDPVRLQKFIKKYNDLLDMPEEEGPYHYGSHYSNSGSVLHFLLRIEPFSGGFLDFQGGKFDVPDRAFHSIDQTWRLSSSQSASDVKELIPEFFVLPEFLVNKNRFDFGKKQNGDRVDDVILPFWAKKNPRFYIAKHREALESRFVSQNLHHWIDLIFGCKQQGELAVKALNVFHPCTYEGAVDVDKIDDPVNRAAKIAQISNFGQIPKQLFKDKHPAKNMQKLQQTIADCVFSHTTQLSPFQIGTGGAVGSIVFINDVPVMLAPRKVLLYPDTTKYISWGHWDQTLRICAMDTNKVITTIDINHDDDVLCGDMTKNGRLLVTGGTACVVKVWRRPNKNNREKADTLVLATALCGHSDTVLCLVVSQEWSIVVTGSADKTCIIWDLNRLAYVRSLAKQEGPITVVAVSPTTGDIATACVVPKGNTSGSILRLWSINGDELATIPSAEKITAAIFTSGMEGVVQNLLITGHENGMIKIYSAWDLSHITTYYDCHRAPISAVALSKDSTQLISGDTSGLSVCWSWKKPRDNSFVGIRI